MSANFLLIKRQDNIWMNTKGIIGIGRFYLDKNDDGSVTVHRLSGSGELSWTDSRTIADDGVYGVTVSGIEKITDFDRLLVTPAKNGWCAIRFSEKDDPDPFSDCRTPNRWMVGCGAKLSAECLRIDKYSEFYDSNVACTKELYMCALDLLRSNEKRFYTYRPELEEAGILVLSPKNWRTRNLKPIMFKLDGFDQETSGVEVKE